MRVEFATGRSLRACDLSLICVWCSKILQWLVEVGEGSWSQPWISENWKQKYKLLEFGSHASLRDACDSLLFHILLFCVESMVMKYVACLQWVLPVLFVLNSNINRWFEFFLPIWVNVNQQFDFNNTLGQFHEIWPNITWQGNLQWSGSSTCSQPVCRSEIFRPRDKPFRKEMRCIRQPLITSQVQIGCPSLPDSVSSSTTRCCQISEVCWKTQVECWCWSCFQTTTETLPVITLGESRKDIDRSMWRS